MKLVMKSGREMAVERYEENWTVAGATRAIMVEEPVDPEALLATLTEDELSAAIITGAAREIALPPVVAESAHRSIDDLNATFTVRLVEAASADALERGGSASEPTSGE